MNNDSQKAIAPSNARRRLVRGAFSAPALLTLCSGSALAATSLTCRSRAFADTNANSATNTVPMAGSWLSVKAYTKNSKYYIRNSDVLSLATSLGGTRSYLGTTSALWQDVSTSGYPTRTFSSGQEPSLTSPLKYVAVKVDVNGNVVGFSGSGAVANSAMMSMGCWSSIIV